MALEEINYLWEHWKFNAEQRIKAFNFFVVFAVFLNGGVFTSIEKCASFPVFVMIGTFIVIVAAVFWIIDVRSQGLIHLSIPGIKAYEQSLTPESRLFHLDEPARGKRVRFTYAFRTLFVAQIAFGVVVAGYGLAGLAGPTFGFRVTALAVCK